MQDSLEVKKILEPGNEKIDPIKAREFFEKYFPKTAQKKKNKKMHQ